jgi:hypothetical protein
MRERFAANCNRENIDPDEKLREFLGNEIDAEVFWEMADRNLKARKLRLLFVADVIPAELQRIVEFLNDQMDQTEVLAIEIKQFVSEKGLRSLVPRVIGQTAKAQQAKSSGSRSERQWDESTVMQTIEEKRGTGIANVARRLIEWARKNASDINWGKGATDGSFSPLFDCGLEYPVIPFRVYTYGNAEILFNRLVGNKTAPFDQDARRLELLRRLNEVPGIELPESGIHRRPAISLRALVERDNLSKFLSVIEWELMEIRSEARVGSQ